MAAVDDPDLEQRLARFEAQLDRFSLAFRQWQETHEHPQPGPLDLEERLRKLEETLEREAGALRQLHEEPLKQLQAQAAGLTDLCVAATSSVQRLDSAEARLAEFQTSVQLLLSEVSRSLQAIVTDLRFSAGSAAARPSTASWPLDRVVNLHDELRQGSNGHDGGSSTEPSAEVAPLPFQSSPAPPSSRATSPPASRGGVFDDVIGPSASSFKVETSARPRWKYFVGVLAVAATLLVIGVARWVEGKMNDASARVAAAERQVTATTQLANREVVAARQDADRQITEARQLAQRAETVGAILTAPDLIRFNLTSTEGDRSSAQVLWSRTRGLVLSGSRLPAAPPKSTYQLWLMTAAQPVSAGLFVPDADGRATLVVDAPPRVLGPVVGAAVTVEPTGGGSAPSGRTLLTRIPRASL